MAGIKDVAREAGVSVATVSRVINGTNNVAEATKKLVLDTVERMGYRPNLLGKNLRRSETRIIFVMLSSLANTFCANVIRSIDKHAKSMGYYVAVCATNGDPATERYYIEFAGNRLADGLIILNSSLDSAEMSRLSERMPVVQCCEYADTDTTSYVTINNEQAAYDAVTLLLANGRRRIAFFTVDNSLISSSERMAGYRRALSDNGLEFDEGLILYGNYGYKNARTVFEQFVQSKTPCDALFAVSDRMAAGAAAVLVEKKVKIPEEFEIIGFDNTDISYTSNPSLTTVSQPHYLLGKNAIEQLVAAITSGQISRRVLEHKIIRRNSTK